MATPPHKIYEHSSKKKRRDSNLELYRIIVMLLIVAHHYVVNSGLFQYLSEAPLSLSSVSMILFGAWGKTGINCFVLITGYFMCKSRFTWEKLLKLYIQILFYAVIIYSIFCFTGHERFSVMNALWILWPVKSISSGFTSCFLIFYLFIPFLNVFLQRLDKRRHSYLMVLLVLVFSVLPTVPKVHITFNYVGWFCIIYIIGAYLRNYGKNIKISHASWGWIALGLILIGSASVVGMTYIYKKTSLNIFTPYFFIADCNKILSLAIAISTFMFFKDLKIPYSRLINAIGGATFGVLLIHANSDTMRRWLWKETIDCVGNFKDDLFYTLTYATVSVFLIFIICAGIDWFRGQLIEPKLMDSLLGLISKIKERIHFDADKEHS